MQFKLDLARLDEEITELDNRTALLYEEGEIDNDKHKDFCTLHPVMPLSLGGGCMMVVCDSVWCEELLPSGFSSAAPVGDGDGARKVSVEIDMGEQVNHSRPIHSLTHSLTHSPPHSITHSTLADPPVLHSHGLLSGRRQLCRIPATKHECGFTEREQLRSACW